MAWINVGVLLIATLLTGVLYVKSVGPAALEQRIGARAYVLCSRYRLLAGIFMGVATVNYVLYFFFPLPLSLPRTFAWPWWVSAAIALAIAIPSGILWVRGMADAGEETMVTKKEHTMYGGIYEKMRHPQAAGEAPIWFVVAFLLHSPFLVLYSLVWIPIFVIMCLAEERDLVVRYGAEYETYRERTGFLLPKRH